MDLKHLLNPNPLHTNDNKANVYQTYSFKASGIETTFSETTQDQCERYTLYYKGKNVKRKGSAKKTTNQCFSYYLF